jgi:hypothetical protein
LTPASLRLRSNRPSPRWSGCDGVFLDLNGISIDHPSEALYELTMGVAEGRVGKPAVAAELERIAKSKG